MSIQADLLNPELGYRDEGLTLSDLSLYESARRPFGMATVLPPVAYRSKTFLELESEKIWTRSWASIGLGEQIPSSGDLLPFTLGFHGLHVQRNPDGSIAARMNRHQHGGCRFVPVQCRTGMQTKCSITSCNYTRDADAMTAGEGGANSDEMFKFVGLVPEKLQPVNFDSFGPFLFVNLDPECGPLDSQLGPILPMLPSWLQGPLSIRAKLWLDVKANWKEVGVGLLDKCEIDACSAAETDVNDGFICGRLGGPDVGETRIFWLFPNLLFAVGEDYVVVVILQSTAPGKTLCRFFVLTQEGVSDTRSAELSYTWIAHLRAAGTSAEALHQDHVTHGTASKPGTRADVLPVEERRASHMLNMYLSGRICAEHKYYWTAPVMDAAMLMRGVR